LKAKNKQNTSTGNSRDHPHSPHSSRDAEDHPRSRPQLMPPSRDGDHRGEPRQPSQARRRGRSPEVNHYSQQQSTSQSAKHYQHTAYRSADPHPPPEPYRRVAPSPNVGRRAPSVCSRDVSAYQQQRDPSTGRAAAANGYHASPAVAAPRQTYGNVYAGASPLSYGGGSIRSAQHTAPMRPAGGAQREPYIRATYARPGQNIHAVRPRAVQQVGWSLMLRCCAWRHHAMLLSISTAVMLVISASRKPWIEPTHKTCHYGQHMQHK
jgi:hypothetical protein